MSQENPMTLENQNEPINNTSYKTTTKLKKKTKKRKTKSDLGPDFVAPDGGWGWVVCIAAGLSTFSIFPSLQQYGILYRNRLHELGFEGRQITSIVNMELATSTLIGVVNGAMFRRFTFRQVALTGGLLVTLGISLTAFCRGFLQYAICFSLIYGMGIGLNTSATALAVNTYFKMYRRHATSVTWTITGIGPIVFPHISTYLIQTYSFKLAILIIAAISLNTLFCGSTLQPVLWHVRPKNDTNDGDIDDDGGGNKIAQDRISIGKENDFECKYCQYNKDAKRNIFASQYLFNDNDPDRPGYEIIEPATPMLARANDGWFGEKILSNVERFKMNRRFSTATKSVTNVEGNDDGEGEGGDGGDNDDVVGGDCGGGELDRSRLATPQNGANYFNQEREERERYLSQAKGDRSHGGCTCAEERILLENSIKAQQSQNGIDDQKTRPMTFKRKVIKFFDLDLLRDITFVNLVQGMTVMMFGEMNFSFLTPFILSSYGYENKQISLAMSLLGGMDITMRFLAPFLLGKVKFGNSTLFAFGIVLITVARCLVTFTKSYYVMCGLFMVIGFGKAFRTIFAPLIIPSYVPLHRLPAASGLQLVCNTILSLICGPLLGVIADSFGYNFSIHFINLTSMLALSLWILEWFVRRMLGKPKSHTQQH